MNDLKNLEEVISLLEAQEQMISMMESMQDENEALQRQLRESLELNDQLSRQNEALQKQISILKSLKE